jgi:hypothetical protein
MKLKHLAILAALLVAGQSFALTAYQKQHGCNNEGEGCAGGGGAGPGGGGSNQSYDYEEAFIYDGKLWENFKGKDDNDRFTILTDLKTNKKTVIGAEGSAYRLIGTPPPNSDMKRSELVLGEKVSAMTMAQAKKKEAEEKAKAQKVAEELAKKAPDNAASAKAGGIGAYSSTLGGPVSSKPAGMGTAPVMGSTPAGSGAIAGTATATAQPATAVPAGAISARKKP